MNKLEGNAFLFRIPNASTRKRVLSQGLWQIEGQTMFVAKWQPGHVPQKPELTYAPVWLELRNVPFQFFNEEGFEHIASLVGEPKGLHPSTANLTNLEVAKVLTLIDPRKPLPEAVNVQFESGEISRVLVSCPWMPPVCTFCKEVGHSLKKCKLAPVSCPACNSTSHVPVNCPRAKDKKKSISRRKITSPNPPSTIAAPVSPKGKEIAADVGPSVPQAVGENKLLTQTVLVDSTSEWIQVKSRSAKKQTADKGASSSATHQRSTSIDIGLEKVQVEHSFADAKSVASDSSDVQSSEDGVDPDLDETQFLKMFSQRQPRNARGKGPKSC